MLSPLGSAAFRSRHTGVASMQLGKEERPLSLFSALALLLPRARVFEQRPAALLRGASALTGERESAGTAAPWLLALLPAVALYYAVLLLIGTGIATGKVGLFAPVDNGLAFNSMLEHMLRGSFDVDPAAITYEGMVRDGRTYAYFGVFVALLRLPFSLVGDLSSTDFTVLSCLLAAIVNAGFMLASIAVVWRALPASRMRTLIGGGLVAVTL